MFSDSIQTMKQYSEIDTIDKIESLLQPGIPEQLIFSGHSVFRLPFADRVRKYNDTNRLLFPNCKCVSQIVMCSVMGFLRQAFDILTTSIAFRTIPYVRDEVSHAYIRLLYSRMSDIPDTKQIVFRCSIAHHLHRMFRTEKFKQMQLHDYMQLVQKNRETHDLFYMLEEQGVLDATDFPDGIVPVIRTYLEGLQAI